LSLRNRMLRLRLDGPLLRRSDAGAVGHKRVIGRYERRATAPEPRVKPVGRVVDPVGSTWSRGTPAPFLVRIIAPTYLLRTRARCQRFERLFGIPILRSLVVRLGHNARAE
jgi:hypothetical protein